MSGWVTEARLRRLKRKHRSNFTEGMHVVTHPDDDWVEQLIHELAHAVVLGIDFATPRISGCIALALSDKPLMVSDLSEMRTLAVEARVLRQLLIDFDFDELVGTASFLCQWDRLSWDPETLVRAMGSDPSTKHHAARIVTHLVRVVGAA